MRLAGVYVSKDKGETFTFLFAGLQSFAFVISKSRPATMYAALYGGSLIKSVDSGKMWISVGLPNPIRDYIHKLFIDPRDHQKVYVHTTNGIWKTEDGGTNWKLLNPIQGAELFTATVAFKGNETVIFAVVKGNLFVSRNEGANWLKIDLVNYPKPQ